MSDHHSNPHWINDFEHALASNDPTGHLRTAVAELVAAGADREVVQAQLESLRLQLRNQNRDAEDDVVLEVLDFLTGWCSPHRKIE